MTNKDKGIVIGGGQVSEEGAAAVNAQAVASELAKTGKLPGGVTPLNRQARRKMNRQQEKAIKKTVKGHEEKMDQMQSPATIAEVVQIATSVAQDVVNNYHHQANPLIIGTTLQLEILKSKLIEKGYFTSEEFDKLFEESVAEFNSAREEKMKESSVEVDGNQDESAPSERPDGDVATPEGASTVGDSVEQESK